MAGLLSCIAVVLNRAAAAKLLIIVFLQHIVFHWGPLVQISKIVYIYIYIYIWILSQHLIFTENLRYMIINSGWFST